jgi:predicted lysophospholipase L1 biosynthesis ABC-type transport system permease subunit
MALYFLSIKRAIQVAITADTEAIRERALDNNQQPENSAKRTMMRDGQFLALTSKQTMIGITITRYAAKSYCPAKVELILLPGIHLSAIPAEYSEF